MPISPRSNIDPDAILALDGDTLDADWSLFVNKVSVSYQQYDTLTDSYGDTSTDIEAIFTKQSKKEIETSDGNFVFVRTRQWVLRAYNFVTVPVRKRGKIIDTDGTVWVVTECELKSFATHWTCETYALNG